MQKRGQNRIFFLYDFSSKNRKGLSTVIVTLILILVSLVAVGIVWVVVRNIIQTGTEDVGLSQFSLNAKIMNVLVDNNSNNVSLLVKRNAGQGEITGISFVFSSNGDTEVITRTVSLNELEQMKFSLHLTNISVSDLISVSIVPLINQNEKQISGIALDKYNLGSSQGSIQSQACAPTNCSILGYVCGTWNNGTCAGSFSCGTCTGGQICNASGRCVASCVPATCVSLGYQCGSGYANGTCAGSLNCGTCGTGFSCNASGRCLDITAPIISSGTPSGILAAGTTQTNVSLRTDENAVCKYSTSSGTNYASITNTFVGTGPSHSIIINGLVNGQSYNYYARCNDTSGNLNTNDYLISFSIANPLCVPATNPCGTAVCGNVANGTCGQVNCGTCGTGFSCVSGTCQATASLCNNLLLLMHFDANSPITLDSSIYGNNGTVNGATWTGTGRFGGAFTYDGVNDYINIPASRYNFTNGTVTVGAWLYPTLMNNYACAVGASDSQFWFGSQATNQFAIYWENGGWRGGIGAPATLNTWSHVVGIINNKIGRYYIYVNGALIVNGSDSTIMKDSNPAVAIGGCNSQYFTGMIDDVAVWNRSLTSTEISNMYSSGSAISC